MSPIENRTDEDGIRILGSGTCVPSLERSSCAALVTAGSENILIDIGSGTIRQLLKSGYRITDIDAVFLTHFHADHSCELPALLFALKYPNLSVTKSRLRLIGGTGIMEFFSNLNHAFGNHLAPRNFLEITELDEQTETLLRFQNLTVSYTKPAHKEESRAYRFTFASGFSMVYSGDTDFSENLIRLSKGADLLVAESALPDGEKVSGHLTPSLAGEIAQKAEVKTLVLTHFYPECDGVDIESQCRKTFSGNILQARDLMQIPCFT